MSIIDYAEQVKIINNDNSASMRAVINPNSSIPFLYMPTKVRDNHTLNMFTADIVATDNKILTLDDREYLHIATVHSLLTNIGIDLVYSPVSETFMLIPNVDYLDPALDNHLIPDLNSVLIGARDVNEKLGKITYNITKEILPPKIDIPTKTPENIYVYVMNIPGLFNRYLPNISIKPTDNLSIRFDVNAIEVIELDLTTLYDVIPNLHAYRVFNHRLSKIELVYSGYKTYDKIYIPVIY